MKLTKKIFYATLALLPILPFIVYIIGNIGNTNGLDFIPFGTAELTFNGSVYQLTFDENTIFSMVFSNILMETNGQFMQAIYTFIDLLNVEFGFGVSYSLAVFYLAFYYFFYFLALSVFEILTFVPRKCAEIFGR